MDIIRHILGFIFRVAVALILVACVWWLISLLYPKYSARNLFNRVFTGEDFLPSPKSFKGLLAYVVPPNSNPDQYIPTDGGSSVTYKYDNGSAPVAFISYNTTGNKITYYNTQQPFDSGNSVVNNTQQITRTVSGQMSPKELYIRNLSIYEGGHVYTGLSFTGEARDTMFDTNGKFLIVVVDQTGRLLATTHASKTAIWSVPGWTRFQVKIDQVLPNKISCGMIFESLGAKNTSGQPVRVAIPIICN